MYFADPMLSDHLDLDGLAAESPVALSHSQRQNRQQPRQSLADFTKQRQQMQELERQYSNAPAYNDDPIQSGYDDQGWDEDESRRNGADDTLGSAHVNISIDQELSELQADREKEFLGLFCERLSGYPEDVAVSIIDELAERLREKVFTVYFLFYSLAFSYPGIFSTECYQCIFDFVVRKILKLRVGYNLFVA